MKHLYEIAEEIWQHAYQGTAFNIDDAILTWEEKNGPLPEGVTERIDNLGFDCAACGWPCEIGEISDKITDEMICVSCEDNY